MTDAEARATTQTIIELQDLSARKRRELEQALAQGQHDRAKELRAFLVSVDEMRARGIAAMERHQSELADRQTHTHIAAEPEPETDARRALLDAIGRT